jgi:chemosensory pili system protein ChpA (sensor histidine kinase/response regulator)
VILDVAPLVRRQAALPRDTVPAPQVEARRVPLVMVVDDSVTMRKVTGRVLERHNFEVATAKDGVDALEKLAERVPDLMLLDIEMPRMDGYELATAMKADPRLRNVPIIMITSRTGEKHRQRAFDIGVERYLGKPYQEHELLRNVFELLAEKMADGVRAMGESRRVALLARPGEACERLRGGAARSRRRDRAEADPFDDRTARARRCAARTRC